MGVAAPVLMAGSMIAGLAGSAVQAAGVEQQAQATAAAMTYQAEVARNNEIIAKQNAAWTSESGDVAATLQGMKTRQAVGKIKAAQGANNIDVNTGSAVAERVGAAEAGALDELTIRSDTARKAYGYEVAAVSNEAQAGLDTMEAASAKQAGDIGALGTLLSGASTVGGNYAKWQTLAG